MHVERLVVERAIVPKVTHALDITTDSNDFVNGIGSKVVAD